MRAGGGGWGWTRPQHVGLHQRHSEATTTNKNYKRDEAIPSCLGPRNPPHGRNDVRLHALEKGHHSALSRSPLVEVPVAPLVRATAIFSTF